MSQRKKVKGDKPYRLLLEQYPPLKRKRHLWSTPRLERWEVSALNNRPETPAMRHDFYRFSTKPNWAAVAAAQRGAHVALLEAERGMNDRRPWKKAA